MCWHHFLHHWNPKVHIKWWVLRSKDQLQADMSKQRVMELNVTRLKKKTKKNSSWLSRAQARLACLAVVSSGIQGHPILCVSFSFHPPFDNSSSISPFSSSFIVNDWSFNDYIWRWHKLIPASLAKSCSPPDYAKQAYILSLWSGGKAA